MTGYGRGESDDNGAKVIVEVNGVNRKQTEIVINLPRILGGLEPQIRQTIHERISRGRINVLVACEHSASQPLPLALDTALARSYHDAMRSLQKELGVAGEITIATILQAPGVLRVPDENTDSAIKWPPVERALDAALAELIRMREREGRHLAKDLLARLKFIRQEIKSARVLYPAVVTKYRAALIERIAKADVEIKANDERLLKEVALFADRADISEELTRLQSHLAQFAHHLRANEPVGRTLEFITQEIFRELNTLGAKANDAVISQHVVACKAELERIREQIQNLE